MRSLHNIHQINYYRMIALRRRTTENDKISWKQGVIILRQTFPCVGCPAGATKEVHHENRELNDGDAQ